MNISVFEALSLEPYKMVSIIGGGGKTSLMFSLAKELKDKGKKVAVTTSTHIMRPSLTDGIADDLVINPDEQAVEQAFKSNKVVVFGNNSEGKIGSPDEMFFEYIEKYADFTLVEADGAKMLPFKAPREHEPIYPQNNEFTVIVAGLTAIGKPIKEKCHRANLLCNIINKSESDILTPKDMAEVITSPNGQLKNLNNLNKVALVLNQADNKELVNIATEVAKIVLNKTGIKTVITTLNQDIKVKKCVEA